jgi:phenylacetate-CoA ligase
MEFETTDDLAFAGSEAVARRQLELLQGHLAYLTAHSPFYQRRLCEAGVSLAEVRTLADLARLPLTGKEDLARDGEAFLCVPPQQIADVCLTSGTTGRPVAMLQSARDLQRLARNEELSFRAAGIRPGDRVMIAAAIDRCFMAGLAYFLGLQRLGAATVRAGSSSLPILAELVRSQRPDVIVGVPTLLLALAGRLQADGFDPAQCGVRLLCGIGEPMRREDLALSPLGERLGAAWGGARICATYASTEMATTFADCECGCGGHLHPELIVVEIVDEAGHVLPPGATGEVVVTPLQVTGMPLLRFRTGDLAALHVEACPCGRTTPRLGPVVGRKAQMLKVRGTTLFPPAIAGVLQELPTVRGHYLEVFAEFDLSDRLRVVVGSDDPQLRAEDVAERIAARTRVKPEVTIVSPAEVQRKVIVEEKRKPVTFFDYRKPAVSD